jgi:hypothetical protein
VDDRIRAKYPESTMGKNMIKNLPVQYRNKSPEWYKTLFTQYILRPSNALTEQLSFTKDKIGWMRPIIGVDLYREESQPNPNINLFPALVFNMSIKYESVKTVFVSANIPDEELENLFRTSFKQLEELTGHEAPQLIYQKGAKRSKKGFKDADGSTGQTQKSLTLWTDFFLLAESDYFIKSQNGELSSLVPKAQNHHKEAIQCATSEKGGCYYPVENYKKPAWV